MKKVLLVLPVFFLFLANGCKDKSNGNSCNLEGKKVEEVKNYGARLFFSTPPNGSYEGPYILYADGPAVLTAGKDIKVYDLICNFPSYAAEWSVPAEGVDVEVEGVRYEHLGFYPADRVMYDLEITSLKRKER